MTVFSFHSSKDHRVYGFTPDRTGKNLPTNFAPWSKHGIPSWQEVTPGEGFRIGGFHTNTILEAIARDGYFVAAIEVHIRDKIVLNPKDLTRSI